MSDGAAFLLAWAFAAAVMLVLWLWQVRTRNAGVVDAAWAFITALVAAGVVLSGDGASAERCWLVAALMLVWGARLGSHILARVRHEAEDGRYRHLRVSAGRHAQAAMFLLYQVQALWALLFALPAWAAAEAGAAGLGAWDAAGVLVFVLALAGETCADRQLRRFRAQPGNRGQVCRVGLWRYSRHPNYFFEWLHWWAYVLIGAGAPHWWITVAGVGVMYLFLTRLTGIPWTEQQALRSRGAAYAEYQRTTSSFFPLPPRTPEVSRP